MIRIHSSVARASESRPLVRSLAMPSGSEHSRALTNGGRTSGNLSNAGSIINGGSGSSSKLGAQLDETQGERASKRDLAAFWICGLINNYAYVVMLSAAEDILKGSDVENLTALVLLCDIIPSFAVQFGAPWFMQYIPYWVRVHMVFCFMVTSFLLPALTDIVALRLLGVVFASLSSGFGEITFLALSARYHKDTVSAFSSGTGGAGVAGAASYQVLRLFLSSKVTLLVCSWCPVLIELAYFLLMTSPQELYRNPVVADLDEASSHSTPGSRNTSFRSRPKYADSALRDPLLDHDGLDDDDGAAISEEEKLTLVEKLRFMPRLFPYMIPLFVVYFSEYLINQGVAPILCWSNSGIDTDKTYMAIQTTYQVGVFISRSSVNIFPIRKLWVPAVAQFVNLVVLSSIAIFDYVPSFWIGLAIILFEGLMGGAIYVNAFYQISQRFTGAEKEYAMGATSMSYATSISLAAIAGLGWTPFLASRRKVFVKRHPRSWSCKA